MLEEAGDGAHRRGRLVDHDFRGVRVDLVEAKLVRHLDPVGGVGFGQRAEVEQVRTVVEGDVAGPGAGDPAHGEFAGAGQGSMEGDEHGGWSRGKRGGQGGIPAVQAGFRRPRGLGTVLAWTRIEVDSTTGVETGSRGPRDDARESHLIR